jgi:hypothetical protein
VNAKSHHSAPAQANHSHHAAVAHPGAAPDTLVNAVCQPDCCHDVTVLAAFVTARFDGTLSSVPGFLVPTGAAASARRISALTDPHGAAPPGRSSRIIQLSLRI